MPRPAWLAGLFAVGLAGACATAPAPGPKAATPAAASAEDAPRPRPADAEATLAYYREQAKVLAAEKVEDVEHVDFARFRRGRLYAGLVMGPGAGADELSQAFNKSDFAGVVAVTSKILAEDQANARAHMLRAFALNKLDRPGEADFHRAVGRAMIKSILDTGDGRSAATAWTVFQVREEYDVLKALGLLVESQSLKEEAGKRLDVLEAREPKGDRRARLYFDITEVWAEEGRAFSGAFGKQ